MCDGVEGQMPLDSQHADIAFIGEAPGRVEIDTRKVFSGPSGDLFDKILEAAKIDRTDCYVGNTTLCVNLGKEHTPTPNMTSACRPRLISTLKRLRPKIVIALGGVSANVLLKSDEKITTIQGSMQWSDELNAFVIPTFHPASVLYGSTGNFDAILAAIKRAGKLIRGEVPMPVPNEVIHFTHARTAGEVSKALTAMSKCESLALDVETEALTDPDYTLLMVQASDGANNTWVLDASTPGKRGRPLLTKRNRIKFAKMLNSERTTWILHNMQFDFQYLQHHFGTVPAKADDTMAMALCLTEKGEEVGLKRLAREWLNAPFYEAEIKQHIYGNKSMASIPRDVLAKYGAQDVIYTHRLRDILSPLVDEADSRFLYEEILLPTQRSFAEMRSLGTMIDSEYATELYDYWKPIVDTAKEDLRDFADEWGFDASKVVVNPKDKRLLPTSAKQKAHLIYDLMGYKRPPKLPYKIAPRTTGKEFREYYKEEPVVKLLENFVHTEYLLNNYVIGLPKAMWPDQRVHPDFLLYGTVTGRPSIRDPALQTIPREDSIGDKMGSIKKMFIAPPGYTIVEADYSQLEVRVAWHYTGDVALGEACLSEDVHTMMASRIHNKSFDLVTPDERQGSKTTTFRLMYGGYGRTPAEVAYIEEYWARYPDFAYWWHEIREQVLETGELRSTLGRTRRWKLLTPDMVNHVQNQAVNFPIQSLASDMCLMALNKLNRELRAREWGSALFTVYDSILFEIKDEFLMPAIEMIQDVMTTPTYETQAVFHVDIKAGQNWGEAKAIVL